MKVGRLGSTVGIVGTDGLEEVGEREIWGDLGQDPERLRGAKVRSEEVVARAIGVGGDGGIDRFYQEAVVLDEARSVGTSDADELAATGEPLDVRGEGGRGAGVGHGGTWEADFEDSFSAKIGLAWEARGDPVDQ